MVASRQVERGRSPEKVVLCSPSAIFADNLAVRPDADPNLHPDPLIKTIQDSPTPVEVHVLFGQEEYAQIIDRSITLAERFGIEQTPLPFTRHNVETPIYIHGITTALVGK